MATELEQVELDFLILADAADVVNGKLYMMGGAWDRRFVNDFAQPVPVQIAVGILVPWNLTNEPHTVQVHIEDENGAAIEPRVQGRVTVGRPPYARKGQMFRAMAVIKGMWKLPAAGTYRVVASLAGGAAAKSAVFQAEQVSAPPPRRAAGA
jgi:hypothetical protein